MSGSFWLCEQQFSKIKPLLPNQMHGVPRVDERRMLLGIIFYQPCRGGQMNVTPETVSQVVTALETDAAKPSSCQ